MYRLAVKMLVGDKAKYIGIILGLSFSSFIIVQQAAIFIGLMTRTFGFITDTSQVDIWVMDEKVQFIDDLKPLKDTDLYRIRGIEGVEFATPLYKGLIKARLSDGTFQLCNVIGIDDATLIGGPPTMAEGKLSDLRNVDAIVVNKVGAEGKLAKSLNGRDGPKDPLRIGEVIELNDHRASVVGICEVSRTFQSQPVIYTTINRALSFAPKERKLVSFILVKSKPGVDPSVVVNRIKNYTNLTAYTSSDFEQLTVDYYMKNTGIPINFGIAVILGLIIGAAISGQTFYNFILDNIRYLAVFKAMGANNKLLSLMTMLQILWVGLIGWGIGIGFACLFGFLSRHSELSFLLPWQLLLFSFGSMIAICLISVTVCLLKIRRIEPAIVFKS